jgi:hypothetical protein
VHAVSDDTGEGEENDVRILHTGAPRLMLGCCPTCHSVVEASTAEARYTWLCDYRQDDAHLAHSVDCPVCGDNHQIELIADKLTIGGVQYVAGQSEK